MTEPGKNRSPLELEVMELLELRETLLKETAERQITLDDMLGEAVKAERKMWLLDVPGMLKRLEDQRSAFKDGLQNTVSMHGQHIDVSIDRLVELVETLRDLESGK